MCNAEIKFEMKMRGVCHWQIANYLGISEATFYRKMRVPLDPEFEMKVRTAINALTASTGSAKIQSAGSTAVVDK